MNTSKKAELTASIRPIERFWKSEIDFYNSEVQEKIGRRIQAIAKHYALQGNAKNNTASENAMKGLDLDLILNVRIGFGIRIWDSILMTDREFETWHH